MKKTIAFLSALSVAIAMNGCGLLWLMESSDSQERSGASGIETEAVTDTPTNQLDDLQVGDSVTIGGVTVTVNSVIDSEASVLGDTIEVNITYINNSERLLPISPYDWSTLLHTGSDRAHVGGDSSFHLENISKGESWTGVVSLWKPDNAEKIKFESSSINLRLDHDASAAWVIPEELLGTTEATETETRKNNSGAETEIETTQPTTEIETMTETTEEPTTEPETTVIIETDPEIVYTPPAQEYWINTDSGKYHSSRCRTIKNEDDPHWIISTETSSELENQGYSPCGVCLK